MVRAGAADNWSPAISSSRRWPLLLPKITRARRLARWLPDWTATSANLGAAGSAGDNAWVDGGNTGIEAGHAKNDALQSYPDATLPDTGGSVWLQALKGSYV